MTPDEVLKKMIKGVPERLHEDPKEVVKACTENGTHLISCDRDGYCDECGYAESIEDFE